MTRSNRGTRRRRRSTACAAPRDEDPTEPEHSGTYPFPPVPDEPEIADLRRRLSAAGLHPAHLPLGVDIDRWMARARDTLGCVSRYDGRQDGCRKRRAGRGAAHPNVELRTGVTVERLELDDDGRISGLLTSAGRIEADQVVLAAGAVHTPVLLLRSATETCPNGLGQPVRPGRTQLHEPQLLGAAGAFGAAQPVRLSEDALSERLVLDRCGRTGNPWAMCSFSGACRADPRGADRTAEGLANLISAHAIDFYVMSEDLPDPESRVTLQGDEIVLNWTRSNWASHEMLVAKLKKALRRAGFRCHSPRRSIGARRRTNAGRRGWGPDPRQ
jgi:hypothetical protein